MMKKALKNFYIDVPKNRVLMRLGKKFKTRIPPKIENKIDEIISSAKNYIETAGVYEIFAFSLFKDKRLRQVIINDDYTFNSKYLFNLLKDSEKTALAACTIGSKLSERVKFLMETGNMSDAVILDAFGSESAESCIEYIHRLIEQSVRLQGYKVTRRFSPGYGDVSLTDNQQILKMLGENETGITINESCIMSPEKSVTAIIGLEKSN